MNPVNGHEIRVIGMSRGGNHALIGWILRQLRGRSCFLNCTQGRYSPYYTPRPMDTGDAVLTNIPNFDLEAEKYGRWQPKDYLLYSHEDSYLGTACSDRFEAIHDEVVGPSARRTDVLILRDPFNLFASRRRLGLTEISDRVARTMWKQHAREFAKGPRRLRHDPLLVNYNRWCTSVDERRRISAHLELEFNDAGRRDVLPCHGGSSFDGRRYDGEAERMPVFERWRHYADDPAFLDLFDAETVDLAEAVFGPMRETEELVATLRRRLNGAAKATRNPANPASRHRRSKASSPST